jgi:signal transduction histidine kinase
LNNLISNAIKYKDVSKEESFVTILLNDNENAIITIEDNGIGMQKINREGYLRCFIAPPNFHWLRSWYVYCKRNTREN